MKKMVVRGKRDFQVEARKQWRMRFRREEGILILIPVKCEEKFHKSSLFRSGLVSQEMMRRQEMMRGERVGSGPEYKTLLTLFLLIKSPFPLIPSLNTF